MNMKKVIAAIVLGLFTIPAFASAYTYDPADYSGVTETLVEGHTVFAVIQASLCIDYTDNESTVPCPRNDANDFDLSYDIRANVTVQRLGTAVAVLVRDRVKPYVDATFSATCESNRDLVTTVFYENPGVLWFNDQFLVGDDLDIVEADVDANIDVCIKEANVRTNFDDVWRYPCGGWVLATQHGMPDPRGATVFPLWTYEESYRIEDPNGYVWIIDKFGVLPVQGPVVTGVDQSADLPQADTGLPPAYVDPVTGEPFIFPEEGISAPGDEDADGDDAADGDARAVVGSADGGAFSYYLGTYNMWSVPILGADTTDAGPTSGSSCAPYQDVAAYDVTGDAKSDGNPYTYGDGDYDTTDQEGMDSRCVTPPIDPACPAEIDAVNGGENARLYNAVLFFFFEDLLTAHDNQFGLVPTPTSVGLKVHGEGQADDDDVTGCQEGTEWTCGDNNDWGDPDGSDFSPNNGQYNWEGSSDDGANDDMEGNSHPYNPTDTDSGATHIHPTTEVDLYFHNVRPPSPADALRTYAVYDTVGTAAPFHAHQPAGTFDDRVRFDACADADRFREKNTYWYNGGGTYTGNTTGDNTEMAHAEVTSEPAGADARTTPDAMQPSADDCYGAYDGGYTGYYDPAYPQYGGEYY